MSKKMKLNLDDLKVDSFVTTMDKETEEMVKGGWAHTQYWKMDTCAAGPPCL